MFSFFLVFSTAKEEKVLSVQAKSLEKLKKKNVRNEKLIEKYKNSIERQQNEIKTENMSSELTLVSIFKEVLGNENFKLAQSLGLRGTPASVINDSIYPGYIKYEVLRNLIK